DAIRGTRVLAVDDNFACRTALDETLRGWRMRPTTVGDAASALDLLATADKEDDGFDLVLIDAQMPDTDGFALAEQIRRRWPDLAATTVMMLTSGDRSG